ncbi:hypothetical protein AJ80_08206 [Polytolypa hystricis UAMH7299]|uniref:Aminoglycoside phosphotransferase domain-containing protein n=1 Tax=Polytolypa hystricis (strain UAMH7299) TaxID=1447883 RepID=A0A2B7XC16_POLH7|nr:hypothetical protein AJ80_08206 [Polytolypa hystricis UAMH7299]
MWSWDLDQEGVEYIIMEKANGVRVEAKWFSMIKRERHTLASSFVEIEKKLFDLPFNSIRSIYFKHDLPPNLQAPLFSKGHKQDNTSESFCIGPIADYMFSYGKRAGLDIYRGPCTSIFSRTVEAAQASLYSGKNWKDYLRSIAEREIESTRRYGKPFELDFPHNGPFPGKQDPKQYIALLQKYLALVPYLLPKDDSNSLNQPTLRHPDLNPNNVFISPETGPITSIIDWQHATIEPRLLVAGYPRAFENPEINEPLDLEEPKLPAEYDSLGVEEKAEADELYRRQTLFHYYHIFNGVLNKAHLSALRDPLLHLRKHLVDRASRQWSGNLITLMGALWRDEIGVNEDGWVSNEGYEDAVRRARQLKNNLTVETEGDEEDIALLNKGWPFQDHEEVN